MADIKSTDRIAEKWARVTPQRTQDYTEGIESPRRPWAEATAAAEETYKAGVTQAANKGRFSKGVRATGNEGWQRKTRDKGPQRFAEGPSTTGQRVCGGSPNGFMVLLHCSQRG